MSTDEFQAALSAIPATVQGKLARYWDIGLLITLCLFLVSMVGWQLMPQPEATIQLQAASALPGEWTTVPSSSSDSPDLADTNEATKKADSDKPKPRHYPRHNKKPAIPPVINLNQASATQLQLLPGIGPAMAKRILEYRKATGPFSDPAQIMDVKGIGPKKYEKMKAFIRV